MNNFKKHKEDYLVMMILIGIGVLKKEIKSSLIHL